VLTRVLIYVGCIAALPALRRQPAPAAQVLHLPGGLVIPGIAMLTCLVLLSQVRLMGYVATGAMLSAGTVLYALARRN